MGEHYLWESGAAEHHAPAVAEVPVYLWILQLARSGPRFVERVEGSRLKRHRQWSHFRATLVILSTHDTSHTSLWFTQSGACSMYNRKGSAQDGA